MYPSSSFSTSLGRGRVAKGSDIMEEVGEVEVEVEVVVADV